MDAPNNQVDGRFNYERYSIQSTGTPRYSETGLVSGGFGYETFVHEIGHGLGFMHPHETEGQNPFPGVTKDDGEILATTISTRSSGR